MTKTELQNMREAAHKAVAEALRTEALSSYYEGTPGGGLHAGLVLEAERAAFVAIDKVDTLWAYAQELEAQVAYTRQY